MHIPMLKIARLPQTLLLFGTAALNCNHANPASIHSQIVPQCTNVTLTAAYLAEEKPGAGPGFLLKVQNNSRTPITTVDPAPLSVHWYAEIGAHWLWRASSGSGGALVNALNSKGPLFAQALPSGAASQTRIVAAGDSYSWTVWTRNFPALAYHPGCQHCASLNEQRYEAVLAYAVRPPSSIAGPSLLPCGLRSNPVAMPPLPELPTAHNSAP